MGRSIRMGGVLFFISALVFILIFSGCGEAPGNTVERVPVYLSDVFAIGAKAAASHGSDAGWLVPDTGSGTWRLDSTDLTALGDGTGTPYDGVRLWNIDGDLMVRNVPFDASAYDGVVFRYRTNCTEITPKFLDFSYRWAVYGINFKAHDYAPGFNNPGEYKEIVVPFYKAVRNVEALSDYPDNNPNNFDYNQLRQLTFDMRSAVDGGAYWCEIVDFDFFVYK
ncbi:MAG: hypothetical protein LBS57_01490 [Treponema sp.]|nr:hypothetical protein [Treponema sp.]